ncbi:MAG: FAD-binding oxidoreductase [Coleofasciculaceae cyanobacterium]
MTIVQELQTIVGDAIVSWENLKPHWQQVVNAMSQENLPCCIVYPHTTAELKSVLQKAYKNNWRVLPCGSGSKLEWGGLANGVDLVVSTERLNRIIEHAVGDLTVTVEAGVKLADLQAILHKVGQFLPLEPAYPQEATLGGIVATADSGALRHRYGGIRDMLLGVSFIRSDGESAKAGGRVVKNVAGYDLMKLFTGSYGTLAVISEVTFRVYPIPQASATVVLTGEQEAVANATKILLASALTPTAVDLISSKLVSQLGFAQGMGLMVRFQSVTESVKEQSSRLLSIGEKLGLQSTIYLDDVQLWQSLPEQIWNASQKPVITCKIGVSPIAAVSTLTQLEHLTSAQGIGLIHGGSGLGLLQLDATVTAQTIMEMRQYCESKNGFLTILAAPATIKKQIDVWGYKGNALEIMRQIKQQFDPKNLLSPNRFVGGI